MLISNIVFGEGCGFETGTYKRYIPGIVTNVVSVKITRNLQMPVERNENEPQPESPRVYPLQMPTYAELYADAYPSPPMDDDFDDYDDYEPKLSDFYDEMEELELNTRGDGCD